MKIPSSMKIAAITTPISTVHVGFGGGSTSCCEGRVSETLSDGEFENPSDDEVVSGDAVLLAPETAANLWLGRVTSKSVSSGSMLDSISTMSAAELSIPHARAMWLSATTTS